MSTKIYTRTGDSGQTSLFGGGRVAKSHPRVAAYGDVDELNSIVGFVRSTEPEALFDDDLAAIQRDLFVIGGHLATPHPEKVRAALARAELPVERITAFEQMIDDATAELEPLRKFILPGGTPKAAAFHLARVVCRRAERQVVALAETEEIPEVFLTYLNRLSDLFFTLARLANHQAGIQDVTW